MDRYVCAEVDVHVLVEYITLLSSLGTEVYDHVLFLFVKSINLFDGNNKNQFILYSVVPQF